MSKYNSFYDTVDQIVSYGVQKGILHLFTGQQSFNGIRIELDGKPVLNFGSCSYLGLEFDPRLKAGAKEAIDKYGTQFSESRAYVSLGSYKELNQLLDQVFNAHCVITPTTTLGHIANIPVIVEDGDAVIMDQQVHNSVQTAVQIVKARGVHIELVRHNRMDLLEERVKELRTKHKRIWYMADGIYSMFGDCTPVDKIYALMEEYPELHFYVDDAHGMSIHGKNGRGFVLSKREIHPKMAMATSLNKAFATGGGVLVYGDKEMARKVGTVGGPLLSSGPMQPSALGAAIACAKIHLSSEITWMQEQLKINTRFTRQMLVKYKLPVISEAGAAIFFVGVSLPKMGHNIVKKMLDAGFYVNLGVFPTVPMKQTGIRFTITRLHTTIEIESMVKTLAAVFPIAMQEENITLPEIYKAFKVPMPEENIDPTPIIERDEKPELTLVHFKRISEVDKKTWNDLYSGKGSFDWDGLQLLENTFTNNELPEDNWDFDYLLVQDKAGNTVAATFLTTALWKDDMLSPHVVSRQIEAKRTYDPYYLTSKVTCAGSLITEGEHLYLNTTSVCWKNALAILLEKIYAVQEYHQASHIVLRDFQGHNALLDDLMVDNGFFKIQMPDTHIIPELNWQNPEFFYRSLSVKSRNHMREKVLRHENKFKVTVFSAPAATAQVSDWYKLYLQVKNKSFDLNTFALPEKFFQQANLDKNWEVLQLSLTGEALAGEEKPCCMVLSYISEDAYLPMVIGIDYTWNKQYNIYRQALYQLVKRAGELKKQKVFMGFSATVEKQKLGAKPIPSFGYMHTIDSFNIESVAGISVVENTALA